jgi:hypothetical protein
MQLIRMGSKIPRKTGGSTAGKTTEPLELNDQIKIYINLTDSNNEMRIITYK